MLFFNYFNELKQKFKIPENLFNTYKIVNVGGNLIYVEEVKGLLILSDTIISLKLKKGYLEVKGNNLKIKDLTNTTAVIQGKIYKTEVF